jgi:hypothetical protein
VTTTPHRGGGGVGGAGPPRRGAGPRRPPRPGALVQCGLLRRWDPAPLLAALGADPQDAEIAGAAVGLDDLVAQPPDDGTIARVVSAGLAR